MLSGMSRTGRARRKARLALEDLEHRSLLSGFSPTDIEQFYLEGLNDARFNPAAYGDSLGLDLSSVAPSQPLAMNTLLVESSRLHSQDMIAQGYFAHNTPQGVDPGQRIQATGLPDTDYAESIETNTNPAFATSGFPADYAAWDAGFSLADLIVDQGTPSLGHRVMLLDIGGGLHAERQVGIGIASQDSTSNGWIDRQTDTTIDLASTSNSNPFLTGVVFNDTGGNGEYQPGEGLAGVTITVSNVGTTTTLDAGGYSLQVPPGVYTVTASGGGLPAPIARTVVVQNDNVRLNFGENPNGATLSAAPGGFLSDQLGSLVPLQAGDTASSYSARIDWGDGHDSIAALTPGAGGRFAVTGSNTYVYAGVYSVRVLVTHLSDGQTYALNATVGVASGSSVGSSQAGGGNSGPSGSGGGNDGPGTSGASGSSQAVGAISPHTRKKKHPKARPRHHGHVHSLHKSRHHAIQGTIRFRPIRGDIHPMR